MAPQVKEKFVPVNATYIRNTAEPNFPLLAKRRSFGYATTPWIPKGEIWVDYRHWHERHSLFKTYKQESQQTSQEYYKSRFRKARQKPITLRDLKQLGIFHHREKLEDGSIVYYVQGDLIRKKIDPGFILGGHREAGYKYIRGKHYWIDVLDSKFDQKMSLQHEIKERQIVRSKRLRVRSDQVYDAAHDLAIVHEMNLRRKNGAIYIGDKPDNRTLREFRRNAKGLVPI